MAKTKRESRQEEKKREMADLLVLPRPAKSIRMAQASAEKLEHIGPAEKERVASVPQRESSWQERRSRPCQKEKEQTRLSRVSDHEGGESQCGREPHLGEKEGDQSESMERKGWTPR